MNKLFCSIFLFLSFIYFPTAFAQELKTEWVDEPRKKIYVDTLADFGYAEDIERHFDYAEGSRPCQSKIRYYQRDMGNNSYSWYYGIEGRYYKISIRFFKDDYEEQLFYTLNYFYDTYGDKTIHGGELWGAIDNAIDNKFPEKKAVDCSKTQLAESDFDTTSELSPDNKLIMLLASASHIEFECQSKLLFGKKDGIWYAGLKNERFYPLDEILEHTNDSQVYSTIYKSALRFYPKDFVSSKELLKIFC